MKSLPLGGCSPMSILIALVIAGIILIMVASVNDATTFPDSPTATAVLVSPLVAPANNVAVDTGIGTNNSTDTVSGQSSANTVVEAAPCASGCMLDNMCGASESIIARVDSNSGNRYYYTPEHPEYSVFRSAETQGEVNYYFCTSAQAEAQSWRRAP